MKQVEGRDGRYRIVVGDQVLEVDARRTADGQYSLLVDGISHVADVAPADRGARVDVDGSTYLVEVEEHGVRYLAAPWTGPLPVDPLSAEADGVAPPSDSSAF